MFTRSEAIRSPAFRSAISSNLRADDQAHAQRFRGAIRRDAFLLGRAMARFTLAGVLGEPPDTISIGRTGTGKPLVETHPEWMISISHAPGLSCTAVARTPVGIDIEPIQSDEKWAQIADRYFHPAEIKHIRSESNALASEDRALRLWTLKEAYAKATGAGLSLPLNATCFNISRDTVSLEVAIGSPRAASNWAFTCFALHGMWQAALAVETGDLEGSHVTVQVIDMAVSLHMTV